MLAAKTAPRRRKKAGRLAARAKAEKMAVALEWGKGLSSAMARMRAWEVERTTAIARFEQPGRVPDSLRLARVSKV